MPVHTISTMMTSVLSFIIPLKLTQLVLYPHLQYTHDVPASKKNDDRPKDLTEHASLSFHGFLAFVGSFLYYLVPISKTKLPLPTWPALLKQNATGLVIILGKITSLPLFEIALHQLADKHPYPSFTQDTVSYMQMVVLFTLQLIAMAWTTDIQSVAISLLSGGRLQMLYMHKYPFLSRSLQDLWGRRYNLLITTLLKETVYIPAQNYYNCSKAGASLAAFFTSGVLHSWVAHFTFGRGVVRASLFFVSQAVWIYIVEGHSSYRNGIPPILKAVGTIFFFYATAWLCVGLFVEAMPDWLNKNPQMVPDLPFVRGVANSVGLAIGLIQEN